MQTFSHGILLTNQPLNAHSQDKLTEKQFMNYYNLLQLIHYAVYTATAQKSKYTHSSNWAAIPVH